MEARKRTRRVDRDRAESPELFPSGMAEGNEFHGFGRASRKLNGVRLRKVVLQDGSAYWLRPSFVKSFMTGTVDELAYPLPLATRGVPAWLLTIKDSSTSGYADDRR